MPIRVTCINKAAGDHENPYVAISQLGWSDEQLGTNSKWSRIQMYEYVKAGGAAYVVGGGTKAELIAAETAKGTKYVKTRADSTQSDNLLKLPECP